MTFDGSADLTANADLIAGGILVDFKADQGRAPRKDGTCAALLGRHEIDQLLGYTLMDYSNSFGPHTVAVYQKPGSYALILGTLLARGADPSIEKCSRLPPAAH